MGGLGRIFRTPRRLCAFSAWEFGVWRSPVARFVRDEEVVGSNPATPTKAEEGSRGRGSRAGAKHLPLIAMAVLNGTSATTTRSRRMPTNCYSYSSTGSRRSRQTWETTPDGREGFQNTFRCRGFPAYVPDQSRRGRAGRSALRATITPTPDEQRNTTRQRVPRTKNATPTTETP